MVCVVTRLCTGQHWSLGLIQAGAGDAPILHLCPELLCGPPSLLLMGYQGLFPGGLKWLGHEADHISPSSAEVRKGWRYTSTTPCAFVAYLTTTLR